MKTAIGALFLMSWFAGAVLADTPATTNADPFAASPDFFPILPWDVVFDAQHPQRPAKNGLESIAECHFTVSGFVREQGLPLCQKLGLRVILASKEDLTTVPDQEIDAHVKQMVETTADNPTVLGYFIRDEPGASLFPKLAKIVAAMKKYAPGKLAYINLFPGYATMGAPNISQLETATFTEYLERYVAEVKPQFISYDDYMVQYSNDLKIPDRAAIYFADLMEIRRVSQEHNLPFWNIVGCSKIQPQSSVPTLANLSFQAFTTLAAGGRGLTWYQYYQGGYTDAPIDNSGERTRSWQFLEAVNRQVKSLGPTMNRLKSSGVFYSPPLLNKSLPLMPGRVINSVEFGDKAGHPLMVGEFSDEQGTDYVMVVNLNLEGEAKFKLETVKAFKGRQIFSVEERKFVSSNDEAGQSISPGQGILLKFDR